MSAIPIRRFATTMLDLVIRQSSPEARSWGSAMARELDFVENDWSAALWALGSTTALCRYGLAQQLEALLQRSGASSVKGLAKKIPAVLSGMVAAGAVLGICLLLLSSLLRASWFDPALNPALARLLDRLLFVVIPEALYLASAIALWRQRKATALGILAAGAILIAHAVVHFVTHS